MEEIREQMEHTKEIADAISNPVNVGIEMDEVRIFPKVPILVVLNPGIGCSEG
jgi:hypothetical protein